MMNFSGFEIDWSPWGPSWFVGLVFGLIGISLIWLYRVDGRRLGKWQRLTLLALRMGTVGLVLLALMEPSYKLTTEEERPPVVAVVIDESTSMTLPTSSDNPFVDYYSKVDRSEKSRYAAAKVAAAKLIPELSKTHRIKLYVVSDQALSVADFPFDQEVSPSQIDESFKKVARPSGDYSNLGEVLQEVIEESASVKLSSVFFLTDGRLTGGESLDRAAEMASARGIPINTIGFGSSEALPDLKILELIAPPEANINDMMTVRAVIINTLRPNLEVEIKLFSGDETEKPIVTKKIKLPMGETVAGVSTVPTAEGEIKYTVTLPTFPEELEHDNNQMSFHVNVVKRRLKVLFIAGSPTMEYHHIVPSLIRDSVVDVSCFLQSADVGAIQQGNDIIEELSETPAEWNVYDVVILYDINPNRFTNEQETALEQLIRSGGGVLFIAGRVHGLSSLLQVRGHKMEAMLPVKINKNRHPDFDANFTEEFHVMRTKQGKQHPVLLFNPMREKNDEVWKSFEDINFYWNQPVMGVKRQAVPLLVKKREGGGKQEVVMAMMRYSRGASIYLGVHTLWRWRYPMESYDYDQLWSQTIRYLAEYRMLGAQRQVILNTDKKVYSPGETVRVELTILDPALVSQLKNEQVFATILDSQKGEYKVLLKPSREDESLRYGTYMARRLGEHEVHASHILSQDISERKAVFDEKKHFNVRMQSLEFRDTTADLGALNSIAEATGGTALDHTTMKEGLMKLPQKVNSDPQLIPHETYDDLWDTWYILLVLISFCALELGLRRSWGLL